MKQVLFVTGLVGLLVLPHLESVEAACCYFSANNQDVLQPSQKAFLTWDPQEQVETFTVQPKFEGNAIDFGMVIPTPAKPKLDEMPRDFFKHLAVFTILEPVDLSKYKRAGPLFGLKVTTKTLVLESKTTVQVLEAGVVGSLDYKIIVADKADDLYTWLKDNQYRYAGDEATLDFYIKKKWFFTVMKIDTKQMKRNAAGNYSGEVTPTRFQFVSDKLVYPLKITQVSVKDGTEALFYIQAPYKMDLPGDFSYRLTFIPMWGRAMSLALPEKLTRQETAWQKLLQPSLPDLDKRCQFLLRNVQYPSRLEWAKKITDKDIGILDGREAYNRVAPPEDIKMLKLLKGHVVKGQFITKFRKVFTKAEMEQDLEFVRARFGDWDDDIEYFQILPTSPP